MKDKRFRLTEGEEITVAGPGPRGRIRLEIHDLTLLLTKGQAKRLGAELVRRADA